LAIEDQINSLEVIELLQQVASGHKDAWPTPAATEILN
jgi:hypothetical protein